MKDKDDFLHELMQHVPLESPSDDFVSHVMDKIQPEPAVAIEKKPFYLYFQAFAPYSIVAFLLIFVLATSDIPVFNWLPGKDYLVHNLSGYFGSLFIVLKNAFASRYVSWTLLISFSAGMLFLIDRILSRRTQV